MIWFFVNGIVSAFVAGCWPKSAGARVSFGLVSLGAFIMAAAYVVAA